MKDIEETTKFYKERYAAKYQLPQAYAYAICLKSDNYPIGYINVDAEKSHDFGYALRKEYWHRGITTEAGKAIIEQVKKDGIPFITATHDRNNPRSGMVMQACGMRYCYTYEEQWQPKNIPVYFRMYQLNFEKIQISYIRSIGICTITTLLRKYNANVKNVRMDNSNAYVKNEVTIYFR